MSRRLMTATVTILLALGLACSWGRQGEAADAKDQSMAIVPKVVSPSGRVETAILAGGCFWCVQPPFDKTAGVLSTTVGYTGGAESNPSYKDVSWGRTTHTEAILVQFDPAQVSYSQILDIFWRTMDPTDNGGQFVDRGRQYRPGIFVQDETQRLKATESRDQLAASGRFAAPIVVEITQAAEFWPAEVYHQQYYIKDPTSYHRYRRGSGRDAFIEKHWGSSPQP